MLVNDTICLVLTPLVIAVIRRGELPMLPYLIALATSANIGSVATLVGNPQNMIIGHFSRIPFAQFSLALAPTAVVGLAINFIILRIGFETLYEQRRLNGNLTLSRSWTVCCLRSSALHLLLGLCALWYPHHGPDDRRRRDGSLDTSLRRYRSALRCGEGIGIESSDSILIQRCECLSIFRL